MARQVDRPKWTTLRLEPASRVGVGLPRTVEGYLAHRTPPPPAFSYARGTPVLSNGFARGSDHLGGVAQPRAGEEDD